MILVNIIDDIMSDINEDFSNIHFYGKQKMNYFIYCIKIAFTNIIETDNEKWKKTFYNKQKVLNELKDVFLKNDWDIL